MALTDKLTAIADAIREKTGKADAMTLDQMATEIEGISAGGGSVSVAEKDVNFYDYDGTCLYAYTVEEAQALTELPPLPEQPGLICQGWNWSLEDIKAQEAGADVGAMYITDDGKTRIYINLPEERTSPMLGCCPKGTVTVDWGDGTEPDILTGYSTSTVNWTPNHQYASAGEYIITLTVEGEMGFYGTTKSNEFACILRHSSSAIGANIAYLNAVEKIEIGSGVNDLGYASFRKCCSLKSITIPNEVATIANSVFQSCVSLSCLTIPSSTTSIGNYAAYECTSLRAACLPCYLTNLGDNAFYKCNTLPRVIISNGVTRLRDYTFASNDGLRRVHIPDGVTRIDKSFDYCSGVLAITIPASVTTIGGYAFEGCSAMKYCDFSNHTAVPTLSGSGAFDKTSSDLQIRVPAALYDEWIAATNWSTYASQIVAV